MVKPSSPLTGLQCALDYFQVKSVGKLSANGSSISLQTKQDQIQGLVPILFHLSQDNKNLVGDNLIEETLSRQWAQFEYIFLSHVDRREASQQFQLLNQSLADRTYLVGEKLTAVDIIIFHSLYHHWADMTYQEKESYPHISRWFANLQEDDRIRLNKTKILFSRTKLY